MINEESRERIGSKEHKRFLKKELVRLQAELVKWQETVRTRAGGWSWCLRAATQRAKAA